MARARLSLIVANWLVEDFSYTTRCADPTHVGKFDLTSVFGQTITIEQFQGWHFVEVAGKRVFCQNLTEQNLDSLNTWLEELGAPTMTMVYDALNHAEDMQAEEDANNPFFEADMRLWGYAH